MLFVVGPESWLHSVMRRAAVYSRAVLLASRCTQEQSIVYGRQQVV